MLTAVHTLIYSDDPTATRAFLKVVLRWPFVSEGERGDAGTGGAGTGPRRTSASDWAYCCTCPARTTCSSTRRGTPWPIRTVRGTRPGRVTPSTS